MPGVLMELEMRSVEPGDMKSVIVDEMSIRWSAIRSSGAQGEKTKQNRDNSSVKPDRKRADCKKKALFFPFSQCGWTSE